MAREVMKNKYKKQKEINCLEKLQQKQRSNQNPFQG